MKLTKSHTTGENQFQNDENANSDNEDRIKLKHTKSLRFDPTTQVSHVFPDIIWKMTFHKLPEAPELNAATLSSDQVMDLLRCCLLSNAVYKNKGKRHLPPNLSKLLMCYVNQY